jgi:TonB family protein
MFARTKPAPFAFSLLTHGLILAWVASGPVQEKPRSLYAAVIAPHASKLVWYNFREKLPPVSPPEMRKTAKPPRVEAKIAAQEIVAGSAKAPRARQFVWQAPPKLEMKKDVQSPNLLAFHAARVEPPPKPKAFVPPPEAPKPARQAPVLAPPPEIRTAESLSNPGNALGVRPAKAPPRAFVAPRAGRAVDKPAPALPDAPAVAANVAPAIPQALNAAPAPAPHRAFVPPPRGAKPSAFGPALPDAPALPEPAAVNVSVAIVGLDPKPNAPAPAPEGSRDARFSAGPQPRGTGGTDGSAEGAMLTVPGLLVRNPTPDANPTLMARASPTSTANLRAAVRSTLPAAPVAGPHPAAIRVSSAPDPMLDGRVTYAMTVQMPNITSYTGSWLIWFALRDRVTGGELIPPFPLHKVDPKYYPAAIADRVEGRVRLAAVIRKDGQVDSVKLLRHLDDRLDQSAAEAMDKWRFEPALRNGQPVEVDAVIEIPFRLAPKTTR